jgi:hypothetical protein
MVRADLSLRVWANHPLFSHLEVRNSLMHLPIPRATLGVATGLALVGGALFGSLPAAAATISAADCQTQSGTISVRAVAISQGDTITLSQSGSDGHFEGQGTAEVFCRDRSSGANLGDIPDAQVSIRITPNDPSIAASTFTISGLNGVPVSSGNPATLGPFSGTAGFVISAPATLLPQGTVAADVAVDVEVVTQAWGGTLTDPGTGATLHPGTFGDILAQTPELDSLALFGSGAVGIIGYSLTRLRVSKRRDS